MLPTLLLAVALLFLVLELPPIHQPDNRGTRVGSDFDHVEATLAGIFTGYFKGDDAELRSFVVDEADGADADLIVDSCSLCGDDDPPYSGIRQYAPAGRRTPYDITPDRKESSNDSYTRELRWRMTGETMRRRLEESLGGTSPLLPFADAVVRHLTTAPAGPTNELEVTDRVTGFLRHATAPDSPSPAESLLRDPEVLASFFQNADLLDPHAPESLAVLRFVMEAVQIAWDDAG